MYSVHLYGKLLCVPLVLYCVVYTLSEKCFWRTKPLTIPPHTQRFADNLFRCCYHRLRSVCQALIGGGGFMLKVLVTASLSLV